MTPVECDNLCGYNIIPRATTKKAIQRDRLKNNKNKSKQSSKNVNKGQKNKTEKF